MKKFTVVLATIIGYFSILIGTILFVAVLVTIVWSWVIPDVFSGAVEQGILPASITWFQAVKLSILFSIFGLTGGSSSSSK